MQFEIKDISIDDKPVFDRYFLESKGINSECCFTTMFMWRNSYNIRYAVVDGMLCIFSQHGKSLQTVNFPLGEGNLSGVIDKLTEYFDEIGQRPLFRVNNDFEMEKLMAAMPGRFIFTEERDSFDYVYKVDDLINLSGSKYHAKRNHINRFISNYNYEYHRATEEYTDACLEMFLRWCESKSGDIEDIDEQIIAVKELLQNIEHLKVRGGVITVDGKVVAFSFGEILNAEKSMAVVHLEHADINFQGSFPLINQKFLENEWYDLKYVNREEDMGISGLRKAKKSYHPCFMVKKYIGTLK